MGLLIMLIATMVVLMFLGGCKISGDLAEEEDKVDYCFGYVRWSECNGVDETCSWRCEDG
jgi:hypothetical protein